MGKFKKIKGRLETESKKLHKEMVRVVLIGLEKRYLLFDSTYDFGEIPCVVKYWVFYLTLSKCTV